MTAATAAKGDRGAAMRGAEARWYDKNTRDDMERHRELAARIRAMLPAGSEVLEVASGPGFFSIELARGGGCRVTGLDISRAFVEIARRNAEAAEVKVKFVLGDASEMPFAGGSFDFVACSSALKNFARPEEALREMHRVLLPGGRALVMDLVRDTPMREIRKYFAETRMNPVHRWVTTALFRFLLRQAYSVAQLQRMMDRSPFAKASLRRTEIGAELWMERVGRGPLTKL